MRSTTPAPKALTIALTLVVAAATLTALIAPQDRAESPVAAYSADELTSLDVDVQGALANPTQVDVTVPYTVGADPYWTGEEKLLTVRVDAGLDTTTEITVWGPDGEEKATIDHPVTLSGKVDEAFELTSTGDDVFRADVRVEEPAYANVSINTTDGWRSYNLTPEAKATYDAEGKLVHYEVRNPLAALSGDVAPLLGSLGDAPVIVEAWTTASGDAEGTVHLDVLGHEEVLDGAELSGDDDPVTDGFTIRDADGNTLLSVKVTPPTPNDRRVRAAFSGPLVDTLTGAAFDGPAAGDHPFTRSERVEVSAPVAVNLPRGNLITYYEDGKGAIVGVDVLQPQTLLPLASLAYDAYAGEAAVWLPGDHATYTVNGNGPGITAAAGARGDLTTLTLRGAGGATLATVKVQEGVPPTVTVTHDGATTTVTPNMLLGTVTTLTGSAPPAPGAPAVPTEVSQATVTDAAGQAIATATATAAGVEGATSGRDVDVPGGAIAVEGDPASPDGFGLLIRDADGGEAVRVDVDRRSVLGSSDFGRPHVTATITDASGTVPATRVVATPLVLEGDLESGSLSGVHVMDPANPAKTVVSLTRQGSQWRLVTPLQEHTFQANSLGYSGDPIKDDRVDLVLRASDGATVLGATVDRTVTPAVVTLTGAGGAVNEHLSGPVALQGSPLDPARLVVLDPEGSPLLSYDAAAGDAATVTAAGESHTVQRSLVRIEGNPLGPGDLLIRVKDPQSGEVTEHLVDRDAAVRNAMGEAGQDPEPVLHVFRQAETSPGHFTHADDGAHRLQPHELDGGQWVSGLRGLTFAAQLPAVNAYDRVAVRYALDAAPTPGAPEVEFASGDLVSDTHRAYTALIPPSVATGWTDGRTLAFEVVYETRLNPFVVVADRDTRGGDPFTVRVDVGLPTATVTAPEAPEGATWTVQWEGHDAASGAQRFWVQKRVDGGAWEPWIDGTEDREATFSGDLGRVYDFRVSAEDAAGNLGEWSDEATAAPGTTGSAGGSDGVNDAPTVRLLSPQTGDALQGVVQVTWEAADADGTTPVSNLYASSDGGQSWVSLYAGTATQYYWDTEDWDDGTYRLKLTVTDGSLQNLDLVPGLALENGATTQGSGNGGDGGGEGGSGATGWRKYVPAPGAPLALAALAGAAALVTRRRR